MLIKLFTIYVYLQSTFCGCGSEKRSSGFEKPDVKYKIERIGRLDDSVLESSGLAHAPDSAFWTHSDGDNPAQLYKVTLKGKLLQTLPLELQNTDWEELAEDPEYLYIGDFGNNMNSRRDLRIYKLNKSTYNLSGTIDFAFEDQVKFPPGENELDFDLEAFFYHQDSLYLFTKSRSKAKKLKLYVLPAAPGHYTARLKEQLAVKAMVTAADISPAGDQFAILGYGRLYLFRVQNGEIDLRGRHSCIPLSRTGQAEAILYTAPDQLLITNENGKIFRVTLSKR
ncbi:hypothetical protein ACSX1A_20210 [Pontibacter sp. MBLB2868]|uniref:hypothetical protein n=1 Tax=Pontibacter sp. MBLB2868 TaxID=3451555 RepID=UPI003F753E62